MAITQLENFSGVQTGIELSSIATAAGAGSLGLPGALPAITAGSSWSPYQDSFALAVEKVGNKYWLGGGTGNGASNLFFQFAMNIAHLTPQAANSFVIGIRYKRKASALAALAIPLFRGAVVYPSYTVPALITEWYVEMVFNRTDRTVSVYVDGRFMVTVTITNGTDVNALLANTWQIGFPVSGTERLYITDIYATADMGDDTPSGRLGPQDISDVPMQVVSSQNWDVTNIANVLGWKDHAADAGKYVVGNGANAVLKLKPVDGYVLPIQSNVNGIMLRSRASYTQGIPANLGGKVVRGTHEDTRDLVLNPTVSLGNPALAVANNSHTNDESLPATALTGLEVSLTVLAR
jgi:hypothetical protein